MRHCSVCKNETGFLIAFKKKICYNISVGSKEIWRSALFFVSADTALSLICRFSGEESSDSKYKR